MKKEYIVNYVIPISILISFIVVPILIYHLYLNYQEHEEAKTEAKTKETFNHVIKKKGWANKIKKKKFWVVWKTGENDVEVTYKDEPYNKYTYSFDEDNRLTGDADLQGKYNKYWNNKKKREEYRKRHHLEEKYDLK